MGNHHGDRCGGRGSREAPLAHLHARKSQGKVCMCVYVCVCGGGGGGEGHKSARYIGAAVGAHYFLVTGGGGDERRGWGGGITIASWLLLTLARIILLYATRNKVVVGYRRFMCGWRGVG